MRVILILYHFIIIINILLDFCIRVIVVLEHLNFEF